MNNKDFYKKFEQILNEIFGDRSKPTTPIESFFENLNYEDIRPDFSKFRNSVRKTKDGIITSFYFVVNPDGEWSTPNKNLKSELQNKLDECIKNQNYEEAAKLRDEIKEITNNTNKVKELKRELELVIEKQDFERAIEIRDELKKIN